MRTEPEIREGARALAASFGVDPDAETLALDGSQTIAYRFFEATARAVLEAADRASGKRQKGTYHG